MARFRLPFLQTDLVDTKKTQANDEVPVKGPVGWLLSRQLISKLRLIGLYSLFGGKLDPRDWMLSIPIDFHDQATNGEFWFDYISDTGDGQLATYNVAYLAMSDLRIPSAHAHPGPDLVAVGQAGDGDYALPRGSFLFVGGDTGYHIADYATLAQRFQTPFNWAYDEVFNTTGDPLPETRRPIIAIPANHDYYDALDGFNLQFRQASAPPTTGAPQLTLKGFYPVQNASYVCLKLPFTWWLWGLDSQDGDGDDRQIEFFKKAGRENGAVPDKLIVATPEPSTVYGRWWQAKGPKPAGKRNFVETFEALGLEPAFLEEQNGRLEGKCRLDISGDIHQYARHWGQGVTAPDPAETRRNYASVVAGGGGAFLHPTYTNVGEIPANRYYPEPLESFQLMVERLLQPWVIFLGGLVWLAGALAVMYAYFAMTVPDSTWALFSKDWWVPLVGEDARPAPEDGLLGQIREALAVVGAMNIWKLAWHSLSSRYFFEFAYVVLLAVFFVKWVLPQEKALRATLGASEDSWHKQLLGFVGRCALAGLPLILLVLWQRDPGQSASVLDSLLVLAYLAIAYLSFKTSLWYSNLLVDRAVRPDGKGGVYNVTIKDVLPQWSFVAFSIIAVSYGLWRFGHHSLSVMVTEAFLIALLVLVFYGLYALAAGLGSELLANDADRKRMKAIGHWHWAMQLLVPLFLVLYGGWPAVLLSLGLVAAAGYGLNRYVQGLRPEDLGRGKRTAIASNLLRAWLAVGAVALGIGLASGVLDGGAEQVTCSRLFLMAPLLGAVFSCVWLGWYLVVTALYNGHNNEQGGGSLSADYRHLVRIRLTENDLTAYVIGIDHPKDLRGAADHQRRFRLVDVFTIGR